MGRDAQTFRVSEACFDVRVMTALGNFAMGVAVQGQCYCTTVPKVYQSMKGKIWLQLKLFREFMIYRSQSSKLKNHDEEVCFYSQQYKRALETSRAISRKFLSG